MQNQINLEKGSNIINSSYHGNQTAADIQEIADAAKVILAQQRAEHKPALILIDTSDVQGQDAAARKAALDAINTLDYDRLAIFGATLFIKYTIQFLIVASNKQNKVQYFDEEADARQWLSESL